MQAKKIKIASIIITYNRIDEVKAQMDIIRELWQPLFAQIDIYHEFNGKKQWYPAKYREDFLFRHKTMSHFSGASHMLNQGMKHVLESGKKYDYIIVASADVWFFNPDKLKKIILSAHKKRAQLITSLLSGLLLGTEFFIITPDLAKKIFPLKFTLLTNRYKLIQWAHLSKIGILETIFTIQVIMALKNPNKICLIPGRKRVWPVNRFFSPHFYASHHDQNKRKKDITSKIRSVLGNKMEEMPSLNKFLS